MNRNTCENCLLFWDTTGRCKKCLIVNGMPTLWQSLKPKPYTPKQVALVVLLVFIALSMVYVAHGLKEPNPVNYRALCHELQHENDTLKAQLGLRSIMNAVSK